MMAPHDHLRLLKDRAARIPSRQEELCRSRALRFARPSGAQPDDARPDCTGPDYARPGFDRAVWQRLCAAGRLDLTLPGAAGRASRSVRTLCSVAENLGATLAPEPLVTASMAAPLLPPEHRAAVLDGSRIVLPAWQETPGSLGLAGTTDLRAGRLTGRKLAVPMAAGADAFLVTLPDGLALVARDAPGLHLEIEPGQDGGHCGTLTFDDAPAEAISGDATDLLDQTIAATAAYLLGLMAGALEAAPCAPADDEQRRRQDDLQTQVSLTRAAVQAAAAAMDRDPRRAARQAAVSRAMLRAADAAMIVTRGCLLLGAGRHAPDLDFFRRKAAVLSGLYGAPAEHRARSRPPAAPAEA